MTSGQRSGGAGGPGRAHSLAHSQRCLLRLVQALDPATPRPHGLGTAQLRAPESRDSLRFGRTRQRSCGVGGPGCALSLAHSQGCPLWIVQALTQKLSRMFWAQQLICDLPEYMTSEPRRRCVKRTWARIPARIRRDAGKH
eukprot:CAMPEP_0175476722 /NCGR_PEP_ID=MMETSP0095-20121207/76074_1 /TAXON_ID=311494 /ORGANISM="Alexandrium monilatum, Strain CCMP3105" /LENGTH=140 /DNA_ID=CAMNT_0016778319 /DNA_START=167 /DNA_END=590 /DNA_ORIENTATION=-